MILKDILKDTLKDMAVLTGLIAIGCMATLFLFAILGKGPDINYHAATAAYEVSGWLHGKSERWLRNAIEPSEQTQEREEWEKEREEWAKGIEEWERKRHLNNSTSNRRPFKPVGTPLFPAYRSGLELAHWAPAWN